MLLELLLAFQAPAKKPDPPLPPFDLAKITARIEELGKQHAGAPMVIAVAKDHAIVIERAFGERGGKALETGSEFPIGTLSRQFTAAVVLRLIDEGRIALEGDISKVNQSFGLRVDGINVGQLLANTSGFVWRQSTSVEPRMCDEGELPGQAHDHLAFEPGSGFDLDNAGWSVLWCLMTLMTGENSTTLIEKHVKGPIGLKHTALCASAVQHLDERDVCVTSNATDLVRWNKALLEREVVSEKGSRRIITPTTLADGNSTNYGMALGMRRYGDFKVYAATGEWPTSRARLAYYSLPHVTVVVLSDAATTPVELIEREIGRVVLGVAPPAVTDEALAAGVLLRDVGKYRVGQRELHVTSDSARLFLDGWRTTFGSMMKPGTSIRVRLMAQRDGSFVADDLHDERVTFASDGERAASLTIELDSLVWTAKRVD